MANSTPTRNADAASPELSATLTEHRRSSRKFALHFAEMGAAMYVPFLVLFVPLGLGLIDSGALMLWGHLLMLPAMAVAMVLRRREYAHC
jgi:hypothetical protein